MTTAPALMSCPNVLCDAPGEIISIVREYYARTALGHYYGYCPRCCCRGPVHDTPEQAIAAWNARPGGGEAVREAEDRGYKRAVKMVAALVADAMIYSDSYGVQGSDFLCCMACNAGGAPGVPFEHSKDCIVLKCETIADNFWQEQRDELNYVDDENDRLRAELAALRTHGASHD